MTQNSDSDNPHLNSLYPYSHISSCPTVIYSDIPYSPSPLDHHIYLIDLTNPIQNIYSSPKNKSKSCDQQKREGHLLHLGSHHVLQSTTYPAEALDTGKKIPDNLHKGRKKSDNIVTEDAVDEMKSDGDDEDNDSASIEEDMLPLVCEWAPRTPNHRCAVAAAVQNSPTNFVRSSGQQSIL